MKERLNIEQIYRVYFTTNLKKFMEYDETS